MSALARLWAALTGAQARRVASPPPEAAPAPAASQVPGTVPVHAIGDPPPPPVAAVVAMLRAMGWADAAGWAPAIAAPMQRHGILTRRHMAAFLATCTVETSGGTVLTESLNYDVPRLLARFGRHRISEADAHALARAPGRPADQRAIANLIYGGEFGRDRLGNTEPGDGWRFRGRGLIQVTGRDNYTRLARELGMDLDALTRTMESRDGAAETAARWWAGRGINRVVDSGDLEAVRRAVNGGVNGLKEFREAYARALNG